MKRILAAAVIAAALSFGATARAEVVNFEGDSTGGVADGFSSAGHPDLLLFGAIPNMLMVLNTGDGETDGNSLLVFDDTNSNFLVGVFTSPHTQLSMTFGNDDPFFTIDSDLAKLQVFLGGGFVGESTVLLNRNDLMDQTISFSGGPFDMFSFAYTNAAGAPITGPGSIGTGLIEVVDNITYNSGAPEPAAWALMLLGFGSLGAALRRRRTLATA
jgi:hypothetical protein